jgi:hypothetical protein
LSMQRNVFFHKRDEVKIRCKKVFLWNDKLGFALFICVSIN